jgi:hypothetical protein
MDMRYVKIHGYISFFSDYLRQFIASTPITVAAPFNE